MTATDVILNRDPVSGAAYSAILIRFAAMPWLVSHQ